MLVGKGMYNFVIFQADADYYRSSWNDALSAENVCYIDNYPQHGGAVLNFVHKCHMSSKINSVIRLPFKNLWNPYYFTGEFDNDKPICFLFSGRLAYLAKYGLVEYLKQMYPDSKYVCFYQDVVRTHINISVEEVKRYFDVVISYDQNDAAQYGLLYHPTVYSKVDVAPNDAIAGCDAYFLGAAKDRLKHIYDAYDVLTAQGLKCDFYITGVPKSDRRNDAGLHYIHRMSYAENLQHIVKSKAVVEILQSGAVGRTLRSWEAAVYGKGLIIFNNGVVEYTEARNDMVATVDSFLTFVESEL
ncbi:MAG: hypothetical protein IJX65_03090 [Alistipes sp.]|nr:hypothetical protein [Alistipes sp.]